MILQALAAEKAAVETNPEEIELDMDEAISLGFSEKGLYHGEIGWIGDGCRWWDILWLQGSKRCLNWIQIAFIWWNQYSQYGNGRLNGDWWRLYFEEVTRRKKNPKTFHYIKKLWYIVKLLFYVVLTNTLAILNMLLSWWILSQTLIPSGIHCHSIASLEFQKHHCDGAWIPGRGPVHVQLFHIDVLIGKYRLPRTTRTRELPPPHPLHPRHLLLPWPATLRTGNR